METTDGCRGNDRHQSTRAETPAPTENVYKLRDDPLGSKKSIESVWVDCSVGAGGSTCMPT